MTSTSVADERDRLVQGFARALGADADDALTRYVTDGQGTLAGRPVQLLRWDANSVHGYVFDTGNASVIRGASHVLKELDKELRQGQHLGIEPDQVLYAGGGGGVVIVPEPQVERVGRQLHDLFARKTLVSTCTVGAVPLGEVDEPFGRRMAAVHRQLARERMFTGPDAEAPVPFFVRRCQVCGRRAAADAVERGTGRRPRDECVPCRERIEIGKQHVQSAEESSDYEKFASREGMIAVVYLDGNGIGRTITGLKSPLEYSRFSLAIEQCMSSAFKEVVARYQLVEETEEKRQARGFQMPIAGGDDRVLILPGDVGIPLARDLLAAFEREADRDADLRELGVGPLGAAAGAAIGKARMPVRQLLEEAEDLLDSAKERVYGEPPARSALDFSVVDDGTPRRASTKAARFVEKGPLLLSGKPYTLEELERFSARREHIMGALATSQLHAVSRYAHAGPWQLRNHVLFQIGRHERWRQLVETLAGAGANPRHDPAAAFDALVPEFGGKRIFDVADMIELSGHWSEGGAS